MKLTTITCALLLTVTGTSTWAAERQNLLVDEPFEATLAEAFRTGTNSQFDFYDPNFRIFHAKDKPYAFQIATDVARAGRSAARFEMRKTDSGVVRAEIAGHKPESGDRWYGFSLYLPSTSWQTDANWDIIAQWNGTPDAHLGETARNPPIDMYVQNGNLKMAVKWASDPVNTDLTRDGEKKWDLGPIEKDKWLDFVFHIKYSYAGDDGILEVWKNGTKLLDHRGPNCYNDRTGPFFKIGLYKRHWGVDKRVLYGDAVRVGNTLATYNDVAPTQIVTNATPVVALTSPANGTTFTPGQGIRITANASDSDGSIERVEFLANGAVIATERILPYDWTWTNAAVGTYQVVAKAYDNLGATKLSAPVTVTVQEANQAPTVALTSPVNGSTFTSGQGIRITANASDSDGTIERVEFIANGAIIATERLLPYDWTWTTATVGTYQVVAKAYDNLGATKLSAPVTVTVQAANQAPTVAAVTKAAQNPVTGKSVPLSVLGADDGGEAALTYTWSATGPKAVAFSANGTNAAKATTATFSAAGSYAITTAIRDASGLTVTSATNVTVQATLTALAVTPGSTTVTAGSSVAFTARGTDQFGAAMASLPTIAWSVSGGGTISSTGVYTPGSSTGSRTITATASGKTATATVTVVAPFAAQISFQPTSAPVATGWAVDGGAVYGARGNGRTYGWSSDIAPTARDRNHSASPDQMHDTLVHLQQGTTPARWEIAVPNGRYEVQVIAGDPQYFDSVHRIAVEGVLAVDGVPTSTKRWFTGTVEVQVSDGKLTVTTATGADNAKINAIRIAAVVTAGG